MNIHPSNTPYQLNWARRPCKHIPMPEAIGANLMEFMLIDDLGNAAREFQYLSISLRRVASTEVEYQLGDILDRWLIKIRYNETLMYAAENYDAERKLLYADRKLVKSLRSFKKDYIPLAIEINFRARHVYHNGETYADSRLSQISFMAFPNVDMSAGDDKSYLVSTKAIRIRRKDCAGRSPLTSASADKIDYAIQMLIHNTRAFVISGHAQELLD